MRSLKIGTIITLCAVAVLTAVTAHGQDAGTGAIAGVVKDATGAVLPGVTVEASNTALIEKVRTVVTDDGGNYKILALRPGTYDVAFSLAGFGAVRRQGLQLTTGFTATINAELSVGNLQETISVTGASPVVDVQNTRQQIVLSREVLDTLPTNKAVSGIGMMTLGVSGGKADVGGSTGEDTASFGVHGSRPGDDRVTLDGLSSYAPYGPGSSASRGMWVNVAYVQEITVQTKGVSAESESGGPQMNVVFKEGGNAFTGNAFLNGTGPKLQSDNLNDELRGRGVRETSKVKAIWDVGSGLGGPVRQDTLWFFVAYRSWGSQQYAPNNYFNKTQGTLAYTPDLSRPAYRSIFASDFSGRLTWQISKTQKLALSEGVQYSCYCRRDVVVPSFFGGPRSPEADSDNHWAPTVLTQAVWTNPRTNRVLFEANFAVLHGTQVVKPQGNVTKSDPAIEDVGTGRQYGNFAFSPSLIQLNLGTSPVTTITGRFVSSYVTGSHAFKTGMTIATSRDNGRLEPFEPFVSYRLFNGTPIGITQYASPIAVRKRIKANLGLFAQDQWMIQRLTLNAGIRFDYFNAGHAGYSLPAGQFVPARTFPEVTCTPCWFDINPRLGAAYDVFGNGKTAVKWALGRYVASITTPTGVIAENAPVNRVSVQAFRTWADLNTNLTADCDLRLPTANGECGALSDQNLGLTATTNSWDPELLKGLSDRDYNWQTFVAVQQELRPNVALNAGYYRTWYGNFRSVDNVLLAPADFDQYCITAPQDNRLPGGGGNQICGLYDVRPSQFGRVQNMTKLSSEFGKRSEIYNGLELSLNARFGRGGLIAGGVSSGRTIVDNCIVVDSPQSLYQCRTVNPFKGQTQLKLQGVYPLPSGFMASVVLQNNAGVPYQANYVARSAEIAPSLGRNLSAGAAGKSTVSLIAPTSVFEDRLTQVDLRFAKSLKLGSRRLQATFDVYNAFNANTVLAVNSSYGPAWRNALQVLSPRLLKFGMQYDF